MSTISASHIVQVDPNVLAAGGRALDIVSVLLTTSSRVPIGAVQPFPDATSVGSYFGLSSTEYALATIYFNGFDNSNIKPSLIYFTQYNASAVAPYLRGGNMGGVTLAALKAFAAGVLVMNFDGTTQTSASINLSGATSFSNAAALIQTAFTDSSSAFTASIGAVATGDGTANELTLSAVTGLVSIGDTVAGVGVPAGTTILAQLSGTPGAAGVYVTSQDTTASTASITITSNVLDVTAVGSGTITANQVVTGAGVAANTGITALGTGTGGTGTYVLNGAPQHVVSESMTGGPLFTVSFDSTAQAFVFTGTLTGVAYTVGYASAGTMATNLKLTSATGAVLSQGAAATTPGAAMDGVKAVTQDWALFMTCFDPDNSGNTNKLLFAAWANSQSNRFGYVCWDTDISGATTVPATSSMGYVMSPGQLNYTGTYLIGSDGQPNSAAASASQAAFVCGTAAAIDFEETNGRITFAFRSQTGLQATCTTDAGASNLEANYYNYYGAFATANDNFVWNYRGSVSGPFSWFDSFINQIWLNNQLQLALMVLFRETKSIPYDNYGYGLIKAACLDPIGQAVNFGAIRAGVTLSQAQKAEVNSAAGLRIDDALNLKGWYLQVKDADPQVRQRRGSPPSTLWYMDGQSVQRLQLTSTNVQ